MKPQDRRAYIANLSRQAGHRQGVRPRTLADWQQAGIPVVTSTREE